MSARGLKINEVKRLHRQGLGRNAIARELGVSTRQVDNAARAAGLSFTTARTRAAVRARQSAVAQDREELAELARQKAHEVMGLLKGTTDPLELRRLVGVVNDLTVIDLRCTEAIPPVSDYENDPDQFHSNNGRALVADIENRIVRSVLPSTPSNRVGSESLIRAVGQ